MTTQSLKTGCDHACMAASERQESHRPSQGVVPALLAVVDGGLEFLVDRLFTWQQRHADRRRLRGLDDHILRDIGLSRADVEAEAEKPFWRA